MIELRDVTIKVGKFALERMPFRVESGKYAVLMGRTGQGKTTILETICGLKPTVSGQIMVRNADVAHWSPGEREIGYVPQDLALFPSLTVQQHLEFALRLRRAETHCGTSCRVVRSARPFETAAPPSTGPQRWRIAACGVGASVVVSSVGVVA